MDEPTCEEITYLRAMDWQYLSEELVKIRKSRGLSRVSAAKCAGIGVAALITMEKNPLSSSMKTITRYVDSLGYHIILSTYVDNMVFYKKVRKVAFYKLLASLHEGIDSRTAATMLESSAQYIARIETHPNSFPRFSLFLKYLQVFGYEYDLKPK